jgi:hypothetical protein
MKEEKLKRLIEKYYSGESTEDEEKALRDFFRQDDIPLEYMTEKDIFSYYTASEELPEPSFGFDKRILEGIDAFDKKTGSVFIRRRLLPFYIAAAGFLILIGSYFFFIHTNESKDTFSDPEIAYAETMKILFEVSSELNHGTQALEPVGRINKMTSKSFESINKSTRLIEKGLKNLNYLKKTTGINNSSVEKNNNK